MESLESFPKRCRADGIVLLQSRSAFLGPKTESCVVTVFILSTLQGLRVGVPGKGILVGRREGDAEVQG